MEIFQCIYIFLDHSHIKTTKKVQGTSSGDVQQYHLSLFCFFLVLTSNSGLSERVKALKL